MKILYFDCFSGAAGDMILGALIDAGLPLAELKRALGSLGADGWDITADRVVKAGITATKFRVHGHHHHHHHHHTVAEIKSAIDRSALSDGGKARAKSLFDRLAEAEAAVHSMPVEQVHLHEVGEVDSIIDIVGAVFALEWCAADRIVVSPINVGSGVVKTAHGIYPVPAPATVRLLGSAPVYGRDAKTELLTPTGALVLTDYASEYGPMPAMRVERTGYGAGDRDLDDTPNVLRVVVGESADTQHLPRLGASAFAKATADKSAARSSASVAVIECEIDDMNPQILGVVMDKLHAAGALDVFYAPVQMKKNRPGTFVTIIAAPADREALTDLMFRETTTIGVRFTEMERECLDRETIDVSTPFGAVRFKVARRAGRILNAQPEFEDISRIAAERAVPLKEVQAIVTKAWLDRT